MDAVSSKYYSQLAGVILQGAIKATKFISEKETIKATRRRFKGKIIKNKNIEIVFTAGKPNFQEREFIKKAKVAGEKFPIRDVQIKWAAPR